MSPVLSVLLVGAGHMGRLTVEPPWRPDRWVRLRLDSGGKIVAGLTSSDSIGKHIDMVAVAHDECVVGPACTGVVAQVVGGRVGVRQ